MSKRRTRPRRRKPPNRALQLAQIAGLVLALVMILFFRNEIASGTGKLLDVFGASEDVTVGEPTPTDGESNAQTEKNSAR